MLERTLAEPPRPTNGMDTDPEEKEVDTKLQERFKQLPKVVQDAITSANVEQHLRKLSETHKLHLDQWELLEDEVMLALLGFQPPEDLQKNIRSEVGVPDETAKILAEDVSKTVFEPIRAQLERELDASGTAQTPPATAPATPVSTPSTAVAPATPPQEPPAEKATRAPISEAYKAGEPSTARKAVEDDPYREPLA